MNHKIIWTEKTWSPSMELFNPYHWKKPCKIFVNSMSDTFHEKADIGAIKNIFKVAEECPQHTFQLLTKRPQNIPDGLNWTDNIQLGVTVCGPDEIYKIESILMVPAAFHFISIEPMLGPIKTDLIAMLNLVIVGGESGPGARPMYPEWVRSIRDQCKEAGVPFLFKQWGDYDNRCQFDAISLIRAGRNSNEKKGGRILDGVTHDGEIP